MTKQSGPTKERELILDILMEILENGGYSHVVLKKALDKYQYLEKQSRAFVTRVVSSHHRCSDQSVLQNKSEENETGDPHHSPYVCVPDLTDGPDPGQCSM